MPDYNRHVVEVAVSFSHRFPAGSKGVVASVDKGALKVNFYLEGNNNIWVPAEGNVPLQEFDRCMIDHGRLAEDQFLPEFWAKKGWIAASDAKPAGP